LKQPTGNHKLPTTNHPSYSFPQKKKGPYGSAVISTYFRGTAGLYAINTTGPHQIVRTMKQLFFFTSLLCIFSCNQKPAREENNNLQLNRLAEDYVRLGLSIGEYDPVFVDAYYGPDSLKPKGIKQAVFPKDSFLKAIDSLSARLKEFESAEASDTVRLRASWMQGQLRAFGRRVKIFSGEYASFDQESKDLFGVQAPAYSESHYQSLVKQLDSLLPGQGSSVARFQALSNRFIIPKNKLDTVFKTAIAGCRARTLEHYRLPAGENFQLEFVTDKSWSGYNWYKGNYSSIIQINTDLPIFIERAIDVGSHESYPGHHVYNMLLEKNLYRDKGWVEVCLYPLFSPQSLIAEGSANYGIDVVFPGDEKTRYAKEVLLPLAGIDTSGIGLYFKALAIKGKLNYARNEAARGLLNGTMNEKEVMRWLVDYGLFNEESAAKSISFIKANRTYVINYNYGMDLVKNYIESKGGTETAPQKRWELFGWLLSNEVRPEDLVK
jgi:hypothetical protein